MSFRMVEGTLVISLTSSLSVVAAIPGSSTAAATETPTSALMFFYVMLNMQQQPYFYWYQYSMIFNMLKIREVAFGVDI
jgi:hypothetical protein